MENEEFYYTVENEYNDDSISYNHTNIDGGENDDSQDFNVYDLSLGFINYIGTELDGLNQYELIFTLYPDEFWGENFNYKPAGICNGLTPDSKYIQKVEKIKTWINIDLIQNSGCFSMQDCMDGVVSLAYQNLDGLEEYPEETGRLYFMFGDKYDVVESKLARCHILLGGL